MQSSTLTLINENKLIVGLSATAVILTAAYLKSKNNKPTIYEKDVIYVADFDCSNKDLPSFSPYVLKVITILEYNNIKFKIDKSGKLGPNPKGKYPFIRYNDKFVYDSHFIIEWLYKEFKIADKMDQSFINQPELKSLSHLLKRFSDEAFSPLSVYVRWLVPECADQILPKLFSSIPNPLLQSIVKKVVTSGTRKGLVAQGVGRYTLDEVTSLAESDINALSSLLGEKKYFLGEFISVADISIFSILSQIYFLHVDTPLYKLLIGKKNLVNYVENVKSTVFTDARWKLLCQ